jgi:hypothetical protein
LARAGSSVKFRRQTSPVRDGAGSLSSPGDGIGSRERRRFLALTRDG